MHCRQTVEQIKMNLGMQVGLGPGHIVLDGDPAPLPQRVTAPTQFSAHICCGQMAAWIKMPLVMELGLSPGDFVLDEDPAPPHKFSAHVYYSYCVHQLCTVQWTHKWTNITVLWIGFSYTGPISLCLDSFLYCILLYIVCMRRSVTWWGGPGGIEACP